jgi:hypothetical protein
LRVALRTDLVKIVVAFVFVLDGVFSSFVGIASQSRMFGSCLRSFTLALPGATMSTEQMLLGCGAGECKFEIAVRYSVSCSSMRENSRCAIRDCFVAPSYPKIRRASGRLTFSS